ncbi:fungal-specific transcription factor domain-containing protein [Cristinia sonorae]|uniref:Fungal-specific transcription factor domain-containing protein n=1 Tax=Cristinia sonorae TaxID=1940300 RepID=A0A8K0XKA0_9AGAR|nr:fungal-specific transcription factor domain-containing protein [Cristinia sonorae]
MPQVARSTSKAVDEKEANTKAQEQEFKRARGAISCAECRRLKLKCDKTVPCSSCKRRGCASICPNGSLTTGQGTRFILADTDRLHQKITAMSDRIRQLEDALAILQSSVSRDQHPLLRRELLDIKSGLTLHSATNSKPPEPGSEETQEEESTYLDTFGTLAVRDDGAATFYGRSAGTESLLLDEQPDTKEPEEQLTNPLPSTIQRLTTTFPSQPTGPHAGMDMSGLIETYLPPWPRAAHLCDLYLEQSQWFFGPISRRQLTEEVLPLFYTEAAAATANQGSSADGSIASLSTSVTAFGLPESTTKKTYTAHDLALLFVVFCFGALTDPILPPAPFNVEAEQYFQLTRAAMNLEPVLDRPPSVVTVQALSLMAIYQGLVADENSIESTWALMGLSTRLAQSVGLHRDCARWKLSPQEVQKRRALFWELFTTDCWQSLATGRLSTFTLPFVDTELPGDPDELLAEDGTPLPSFPLWKAKFGKEIVSQAVTCTLTAKPPKYSAILDLDRQIRDFELPRFTQTPLPDNGGLNFVMSHYMPKNYREFIMLYVHRGYFAMALNDFPTDPLKSQYAPSFLAGYRSACTLLSEMRDQFARFPVQIARFWVIWTHGFSAVVMLASVVTHGATTKTSQAALGELRLAKDLFEKAAEYGGRAVKFLPAVKRLHAKAETVFSTGFQRKDIFSTRNVKEEEHDELSIFTGRTRTVATKVPTKPNLGNKRSVSRIRKTSSHTSSATSAPSPPDSTGARSSDSPMAASADSPAAEGSPSTVTPPYARSLESYGNQVHPMLVDQMKAFEGQLDAQISNSEQRYTWMVVESQPAPEPVSTSQVTPASSSSREASYSSPPASQEYPAGDYQPPPPPQRLDQPSYASGAAAWSWPPSVNNDNSSVPPASMPSGMAYASQSPSQPQLHSHHTSSLHHAHYQHSQPSPIEPQGQLHFSAPVVYSAYEDDGSNTMQGQERGDDGEERMNHVAYQQLQYPGPTTQPPSLGYAHPPATQDPHIWNMTPQSAEVDYSYHNMSYQEQHSPISQDPSPPPMDQHAYSQSSHSHQPHHHNPHPHHRHHHHQQHQRGIPLGFPPPPPASLHPPQHQQRSASQQQQSQTAFPQHGGAVYSLSETWTTFMQQELPAPGSDMPHQPPQQQQPRNPHYYQPGPQR